MIAVGMWLLILGTAHGADSQSSVEGMIVDSIVIDNREIFDTSDPEYSAFIFDWANRLHIVTRQEVIAREVLLEVGQPYRNELARETERNLRERLSIYDAWVQPDVKEDSLLIVRVVTVDQWSLTGGLTVSQEGQDYKYEIGFDEDNFLGNNQTLSLYYVDPANEDSYFRSKFLDYRFYGRPFLVSAQYSGNDLDNFVGLSMGRPFYELSQSFALTGDIFRFGGRTDVYDDDVKISESEYEGDLFRLDGAYRWGGYKRKFSILTHYKYRFQQVTENRFLGSGSDDSTLAVAGRPEDSVYHEVLIGVGYSDLEFTVARGIDAFDVTEDITLGYGLQVGIGRATSENGVVNDQLSLQGANGYSFGNTILLLGGRGKIWFDDIGAIRRTGNLSVRAYSRPSTFVTIAGRADHTIDDRRTDANPLTLGGETGIRGYNQFYKTGDRRLVVGLESRFMPTVEVLSVLFGGAAFADAGRVWKAAEPYDLSGFYGTIGAGLRISFERTSKSQLLRVDVAWSEARGWQLSVGTGQYFSLDDIRFNLTSR